MNEPLIKKRDDFRRTRYGEDTINDFNTEKIKNQNLFLNDFLRQRYGNDIINEYNDYTTNNETVYNMSLNDFINNKSVGGNRKTTTVKKIGKKTIFGKERCIYAIQGDRKEYLRYKGDLIPVKDYKKLMKDKK
jgi:hypothetical protein